MTKQLAPHLAAIGAWRSPPLFTDGIGLGSVYADRPFHNLQPLPLHPDTINWEGEHRDKLADCGIFSCDRTEHREKRRRQEAQKLYIEGAYALLGLDRAEEQRRLCAQCSPPPGVWAWSTAEHANLCVEKDREVIAEAKRLGYGSD